ncbi:methylesterase 17 [Elaeis guineensis]|uniref:Methylesterase 17 n=1 Tax=Elaeis guineensis var. tenera TaxID=51953 RepID=A0A6I9RS76_ELAGV|nr:methylesterase 17 [Elaeis guineensis]
MGEEVVTDAFQPQHFVFVHGVGHGAWCWFKVRHLLEGSGHRVTCLDLTSAGIDRTDPNSVLSFEEYDRPLFDFMSALPDGDKVILVGHSAGGLCVTHAMHAFSDKIKLAIFLAATMLPSGFLSEEDILDGIPDLEKYGDVYELTYGLGRGHSPTSMALRKEFQRRILYQLSPKQDSILASMLVRPWPTAVAKAKFTGEVEKVNKVQRIFIRTAHDNMVKPEQQDAMIRRWPPSEVLHLKTDHSPFFSAPNQLFGIILKASTCNVNE